MSRRQQVARLSRQLSAVSSQLENQRCQHPFIFDCFRGKTLLFCSLEKPETAREQAVMLERTG
jgi:hypothetical protein